MYFSQICRLNCIQKGNHNAMNLLYHYIEHFCPSFPSLHPLVSGSFNNILSFTVIIYTTCVLYPTNETAFWTLKSSYVFLHNISLFLYGGFICLEVSVSQQSNGWQNNLLISEFLRFSLLSSELSRTSAWSLASSNVSWDAVPQSPSLLQQRKLNTHDSCFIERVKWFAFK